MVVEGKKEGLSPVGKDVNWIVVRYDIKFSVVLNELEDVETMLQNTVMK